MYPLSLAERNIEQQTVSIGEMFSSEKTFATTIAGMTDFSALQYIDEIVSSGFPEFRLLSSENRKAAFESYFENILSHGFIQQGIRLRQPQNVLCWLRAFAAATATDVGYTEILDATDGTKLSVKSTIAYRKVLHYLRLLDELEPWIEGEEFLSALKHTPKHYLADPAIAAYLLDLDEQILTGTKDWPGRVERYDDQYGSILSRLFKALVCLCLRGYSSVNNAKLFYVKTHKGEHEVDFIMKRGSKVIACEGRFSPTAVSSDGRHLRWFADRMGKDCCDMMIITAGSVAYRRPDGIAVVPAILLGA